MGNDKPDNQKKNKDSQDALARQRELEEQRRKEAELKRQEQIRRETLEKEAIEKEKEANRVRRELNTTVEPISITNPDGTSLTKDEKGRVRETTDASGDVRNYTYDDKGELNSFSEKGKTWTTKDGQTWESPDQPTRTMRAVVNTEDGTFAVVEAKPTTTRLNQSKIVDGRIEEATDTNGSLRKFAYRENGDLKSFTDDKGKTWATENGQTWQSEGERPRSMIASVNPGDGTLSITNAANTKVSFLNGKTLTKDQNGIVIRDKDGQIAETKVDDESASNKFAYSIGKLTSITLASGQEFTTTDGASYTSKTGETIRDAAVDQSGQLTYVSSSGDVMKVNNKGETQVAVTRTALEKSADTIAYAMNGGIGYGIDKQTIKNELDQLNQAGKEELKRIWSEKFKNGTSNFQFDSLDEEFADETSGSDLTELKSSLNKKDGEADVTGRVSTALEELNEYSTDFDDATNEKNIREILGTQNSEALAKYDADFRKANGGKSLSDKILNDPNVSATTKEALPILLKGQDKRTDADTQLLADIAIKHQDMDLLQETFRNATPAARKALQEGGVNQRIIDSFGSVTESGSAGENSKTKIAIDFAKYGKISIATEIQLNTSILGDNDEAIDAAFTKMSNEEKQLYIRGRELSTKTPDEQAQFNDRDKTALENYHEVQNAMKGAGNQWELNRWEGFIVNSKDQSKFLSDVYSKRGMITDSSGQEMYKTVEDMPESVWERLKQEQKEGRTEFRNQITNAFNSYNTSEKTTEQLQTIIDRKLSVDNFKDSQIVGRGDVETILEDSMDHGGWGFDDERAGLDGLQKMTPAEQERYRTDEEFRKSIDSKVNLLLDPGSERDAAMLILERIKNKQSTDDVLIDLAKYAQDFDTNEAEAIRKVQEAFRKDPSLRERINNPQTEEERLYSEQFKKLLPAALGSGVFDNDADYYGKELLETGEISIEKRMNLNAGVFDDDEKNAYKDILYANAEETQRLLNDPQYRARVLFFMNQDERDLAMNNLKERDRLLSERTKLEQQEQQLNKDETLNAEQKTQAQTQLTEKLKKSTEQINRFYDGEMRPEDALRYSVLGYGADINTIKATINRIPSDQMDSVKNAYVEKYKVTFPTDASYELEGQDLTSTLRSLKSNPTTQEEDLADALDEYSKSRGFGANFVRSTWDGTADQTDKSFYDFVNKISDANANYTEVPLEERKESIQRLHESVGQLVNSKESLGNAIADVAITAVAVGGCVVGNPETLGLLSFTTFAATLGLTSAAIKVTIKSSILGNNYTNKMAYADLASGFVDGGLNVIGPAQFGKLFQVGRKTSERTATSLAQKLLEKNLLKTVTGEGAEVLAETTITKAPSRIFNATDDLVMNSIVSGAKEFDENAIKVAARKMIDPEIGETVYRKAISENLGKKAASELREKAINDAAEPISKLLKETFQENIVLSSNDLMRYSNAAAFNALGGATGGGSSGFVYSASQFDRTKTLSENIENIGKATLVSALVGGTAGGGFSTFFKGAGETYKGMKTGGNLDNFSNDFSVEGPSNRSYISSDNFDNSFDDVDTLPGDTNSKIIRTSVPDVTTRGFLTDGDLVRPLNYVEQLEWIKLSIRKAKNEPLIVNDEARYIQLSKRVNEKNITALENSQNLKYRPDQFQLEYNVPLADSIEDLPFERIQHQFEVLNEAGKVKLPRLTEEEQLISNVHTELRWFPARKYKLAGLVEIIVPEEHAIMLDELRKLRLLFKKNPVNYGQLLSEYKYKNALLPEEILHSSKVVPNRKLITRVELTGETCPTYPKAAADAHINTGVIRFFPSTELNTLDANFLHEWAHLTQRDVDVFTAYEAVIPLEKISFDREPFYAKYATKNSSEDWAVHFGQRFLAPTTMEFQEVANVAPLRSILMTEMLERELKRGDLSPEIRSVLEQRIAFVKSEVVPHAYMSINKNLRLDSKIPENAQLQMQTIELLDRISKANPELAKKLIDPDSLAKATFNLENFTSQEKALSLLAIALDDHPELLNKFVTKIGSNEPNQLSAARLSVKIDPSPSNRTNLLLVSMNRENPNWESDLDGVFQNLSPGNSYGVLANNIEKINPERRLALLETLIANHPDKFVENNLRRMIDKYVPTVKTTQFKLSEIVESVNYGNVEIGKYDDITNAVLIRRLDFGNIPTARLMDDADLSNWRLISGGEKGIKDVYVDSENNLWNVSVVNGKNMASERCDLVFVKPETLRSKVK